MKITRIETIPVSVPIVPSRAIVTARVRRLRSPFLVVKVQTDEGVTGIGEVSCAPHWSGEDSSTARHVVGSYLEPCLTGEDPREVERLALVMESAIFGHFATKAGIEMACWDLAGKAAGLPVHRLLGGPLRRRVRTKFSVAGVEPERSASIAAWAREQGFSAMKVKVGTGLVADLARVRAVREALGPEVLLGVDANGGWSRAEAAAAVGPLDALGVAFIEQPVPRSDLAGLADVRRRSAVPVVADESVGTPEEALAVVRAEAADVLSVYVGMSGGIAAARRVAAIASAAGLGWTIGSNLELGIGLAAHLQLAVATPGLADGTVPCDLLSPFYYEDDILTTPLAVTAGWAEPPVANGLGVELDEERMARYRDDI